MKKISLLIIFLIFINHLIIGQNNDSTEICIIGNTHTNTSYFNAQIMDSILNRIHPDLILVELDSSFFTSGFQFDTIKTPSLLDREKSSPSINGTRLYQRTHSNIDIRPFDIEGRNDFYRENDFFNKKNQMYIDIFKFAHYDSLSPRNFRDYILLANSLYCVNSLNISSLQQLNSSEITNLVYLQQSIYLNMAINIVETTDSLIKHTEFAHLQKDFWNKRNNKMIDNIMHFATKYKRIVVITGNMHKYYLVTGLLRKNEDYKLKEFWEY